LLNRLRIKQRNFVDPQKLPIRVNLASEVFLKSHGWIKGSNARHAMESAERECATAS
jgi:hypothetical protein